MAAGPHVSISPEVVTYVGNFAVTNSMVTSLVVSSLIIGLAIIFRLTFKPNTTRPSVIQNVMEWIVESLYNLVHSTVGSSSKSKLFFPFIATFFLVILFNNWFGLTPIVGTITVPHPEEPTTETTAQSQTNGLSIVQTAIASTEPESTEEGQPSETVAAEGGESAESAEHSPATVTLFRPGTADLNMTLALALISMITVQFVGVRYVHLAYFKKFINFSSPINFFVGILELISEFAKILSFAFRLFGNIFAGEVLLVVVSFLTLLIVPVPFYGLEVFVGFIQALVFAMLSLVFFNMATHKHA